MIRLEIIATKRSNFNALTKTRLYPLNEVAVNVISGFLKNHYRPQLIKKPNKITIMFNLWVLKHIYLQVYVYFIPKKIKLSYTLKTNYRFQ